MGTVLQDLGAVVTANIDNTISSGLGFAAASTKIAFKNKELREGGINLQEPIYLEDNTAIQTGSVSNPMPIDSSVQRMQTYMTFNHKYVNIPITITMQDVIYLQGCSKQSLAAFIERKRVESTKSCNNKLATQFMGTAGSNPAVFLGFGDMAAASGTYYGSLVDTTAGYATDAFLSVSVDAGSTSPSEFHFNEAINKIGERALGSEEGDVADTIIMNAHTFTKYSNTLMNNRIYTDNNYASGIMTNANGATGVKLGNCDIWIDKFCTGTAGSANNIAYVFPKSIVKFLYAFGFEKKFPMDMTMQLAPNQYIQTSTKTIIGELINTNRRLMAKIININA